MELLLLLLLPPTPSIRLPDLSKGKEMSSADLSASHLATALLEKTLLGRKVDSLLQEAKRAGVVWQSAVRKGDA